MIVSTKEVYSYKTPASFGSIPSSVNMNDVSFSKLNMGMWRLVSNSKSRHSSSVYSFPNYLMITVFWKNHKRWLLIGTKINTAGSKKTQNRQSFSCGLHYIRAFTGWPMLNNAGNSFENLTWCSELDCIFSLPQLIYFWLTSNKNYNPLIRYQWFGKDL